MFFVKFEKIIAGNAIIWRTKVLENSRVMAYSKNVIWMFSTKEIGGV